MNRVWMLVYIAFANAIRGIRTGSTTSSLSVVTIAVVLVLVGSASLLVRNMAGILQEFGEELQVTAYLETSVDERRADALPLPPRQHCQWREAHAFRRALGTLDDDRCEQNVSDDPAVVVGHQRHVVDTRPPQCVNQPGLGTAFKRSQIESPHLVDVACFFAADGDHLPLPRVGTSLTEGSGLARRAAP